MLSWLLTLVFSWFKFLSFISLYLYIFYYNFYLLSEWELSVPTFVLTLEKISQITKIFSLSFQIRRKLKRFCCKFFKLWPSINFPGVLWDATTNFGPIGSAVLTFIGYRPTNKIYISLVWTNKQSIYLYISLVCFR